MDGTCVMDARKKGRQAASQEQGKKVCRGWWAEGFFCRPGLLGRKKCEGVSRIGLGSAGFGQRQGRAGQAGQGRRRREEGGWDGKNSKLFLFFIQFGLIVCNHY